MKSIITLVTAFLFATAAFAQGAKQPENTGKPAEKAAPAKKDEKKTAPAKDAPKKADASVQDKVAANVEKKVEAKKEKDATKSQPAKKDDKKAEPAKKS